jgi:hypothetical protein
MPLNSTRGAGSAKGFGLTAGASWDGLLDYLIVAGGGAGGTNNSGGGGAGGYRTSFPGGTKIQITGPGTYPVVIGAGGNANTTGTSVTSGNNSSFAAPSPFGLTSAGGGRGGIGSPQPAPLGNGAPGGSGGGIGGGNPGTFGGGQTVALGNQPPVSPPQGSNGGMPNFPAGATNWQAGAGGGGATAEGVYMTPFAEPGQGRYGGPGGAGASNSISGASADYAGGGGGSALKSSPAGLIPTYSVPTGGLGGGGNGADNGSPPSLAQNGGTNQGGGGGGGVTGANPGNGANAGGNGGSGIVILRAPKAAANKWSVSPGTNTKTTAPNGDVIATFTVDGNLVIS